jgi:hypothetical protein
MIWIKAGFFSIIGGFGIAFLIASILTIAGNFSAAALVSALVFGLPIGNIMGLSLYRKVFLDAYIKSNIIGSIIGLILSGLGVLSGLYAMNAWSSFAGLIIIPFASCLGSLLGYSIGLKITKQSISYRQSNDNNVNIQ